MNTRERLQFRKGGMVGLAFLAAFAVAPLARAQEPGVKDFIHSTAALSENPITEDPGLPIDTTAVITSVQNPASLYRYLPRSEDIGKRFQYDQEERSLAFGSTYQNGLDWGKREEEDFDDRLAEVVNAGIRSVIRTPDSLSFFANEKHDDVQVGFKWKWKFGGEKR